MATPGSTWTDSNGDTWKAGSDGKGNLQSRAPKGVENLSAIKAPEASSIDYDEMLKYQLKAVRGIADINKEVMPSMVEMAGKLGSSFASSANKSIASEFYQYLENVDPNWRKNALGQQENALNKVSDYANQLMTGALDQETIDNTMSTMSELGYSKGQFGGLAGSNVARNLGLTSIQLKSQGAQLFTEAVSPLSARLLSTTTSLMPQLVNPGAMGSQVLGFLAGGLGSSQQGQAGVIGAAQTNADLAWSSQLSALNLSMDKMALEQNQTMFNTALKVQQKNNIMYTIGGVVGSAGGVGTGLMS